MRHFIKIALLISVLTLLTAKPSLANTVTLKDNITVSGTDITFGDIFIGSGDKESHVIAPAPAPGKKSIFRVSSVASVARKYGLTWKPSRIVKQVVIRRLGTQIPQQLVIEEIRFGIEQELGSELFEISLSTRHPNIQIDIANEPSISLETISIDRNSGHFAAELLAPANSENGTRFRLSGKIYSRTMLPVLTKFIPAGQEIREHHIEFVPVRSAKVGRNVVTDASDLIGKSPKRGIRPNRPIRVSNLGEPQMMKKGKVISIIFKAGNMTLAVTGKALEAGGQGDMIRVENINSRKILQAQIISSDQAQVITVQQRLAALQ
jgi:flagellar basal body P-ring formation protein FlgA